MKTIFMLNMNLNAGNNDKDKDALVVEDGLTLGQLLRRYDLEEHIPIVNNNFMNEDYVLQDGDRIRFIASGG